MGDTTAFRAHATNVTSTWSRRDHHQFRRRPPCILHMELLKHNRLLIFAQSEMHTLHCAFLYLFVIVQHRTRSVLSFHSNSKSNICSLLFACFYFTMLISIAQPKTLYTSSLVGYFTRRQLINSSYDNISVILPINITLPCLICDVRGGCDGGVCTWAALSHSCRKSITKLFVILLAVIMYYLSF